MTHWKKFLALFDRTSRIQFSWLFFFTLIGAAFEAVGVGMIMPFIAVMNDPQIIWQRPELAAVYRFLSLGNANQFLVASGIALLAIFILKNFYLAGLFHFQYKFIFDRHLKLSAALMETYLGSPYTFHLQRNSAELLRNVTAEVNALVIGILIPGMVVLTEAIVVIILIGLLFAVEPIASLSALAVLGGVYVLFHYFIQKRIGTHGLKRQQYNQALIQSVQQALGGIKESLVLERTPHFLRVFQKQSSGFALSQRIYSTINQLPRLLIETFVIGTMLLVVMVLFKLGYDPRSLAPILGLFGMAAFRIMPSASRILSSFTTLRFYIPSVATLHRELVNERPAFSQTVVTDTPLAFKDSIEVQNVSYQYPETERYALQGISLSIPKGSAIGLVGPTGSGKTTLVDIILGLLSPTQGRILVDKKDISEHISSWRKLIGYIPQFIYLCDDTIRNNIAFGISPEYIDERAVMEAIHAAQLDALIPRLPEGLDTVVGERGIRLSGGERQRLGIARALYHNPKVLIMDEATASLDNETERALTEAIKKLSGMKTLIIIAHRLSTVKGCSAIYVLKDGKIEAVGTYEELLQKNDNFKRLVELAL
jgi:ABC-type multidrug transport system fused ATPase/permease subunit